MSPTRVQPTAITRARRLRHDTTDGERRLWSELRQFRRYGILVRWQAPVGPFIADFLINSYKLVVEVDGEHHQRDDHIARDRARDAWCASQGYRVMRFSTGYSCTSFDGCVTELLHGLGLMETSEGAFKRSRPETDAGGPS